MSKRHRWYPLTSYPLTRSEAFTTTMQRCKFCDAIKETKRKKFSGITGFSITYQLRGRRTRKAPACVQGRLL